MSGNQLSHVAKRAIGSDAMDDRSRRIMQMWDDGMSIERIAAELGKPRTAIEGVVSLFHYKPCAFEAMIRRGSADLAAAILRHHPERAGA